MLRHEHDTRVARVMLRSSACTHRAHEQQDQGLVALVLRSAPSPLSSSLATTCAGAHVFAAPLCAAPPASRLHQGLSRPWCTPYVRPLLGDVQKRRDVPVGPSLLFLSSPARLPPRAPSQGLVALGRVAHSVCSIVTGYERHRSAALRRSSCADIHREQCC